MAQHRMFSLRILNSARFLKMPTEAQVLYFHLCLHADDDGVVEAYPILRMVGVPIDNFKVLVAKSFVVILNEDDVSYIIDWNEHNLIRADRKIDSIYKNLLLKVLPEVKIKEAKPRADTKKLAGQPMDNQWTPQVKLSKVKLSKVKQTIVGKADEEFNLLKENKKLLSDPKRHIQIIGIWLKAKAPKIENKKQLQSFIKRNLRPAQLLEGYKNDRIIEVIKYLKENADFKFTLESVSKFIDEDLKKLNSNKILSI